MLTDVADLANVTRPTSIISSTDPQTRQLLALTHLAGKEIRQCYQWPQLTKIHTFATVDGTAGYALPADFEYLVNRSEWDRTNHWEVTGPLSPQEWEYRKSGITSTGPRQRFRIFGLTTTRFTIDPTPSAVATIAFEYQSSYWITDSNGTATTSETFAADTELPFLSQRVLGQYVLWMFLRAKGLEYQEYRADAQNMLKEEFAQYKGARTLNDGNYGGTRFIGYENIPDGNWS
jgi:hypothetical protein